MATGRDGGGSFAGPGAIQAVGGRDQRIVGGDHHMQAVTLLDTLERGALVIEHVKGNGGWHDHAGLGRAQAHAFFLDAAQHVQHRRFSGADAARAGAMRADFRGNLGEARPQALAGEL